MCNKNPRRRKKKNGPEETLEKVIAEYLQKSLGIPGRIYEKITYPRHVTVKLLDSNDKEKVLKAVRGEKRHITF